ncbi:hypothetical protein FHU31_000718 [Mycolicibacterium fluoranthenivorans]|uniref:Uncharacterized protein n=1 Tax=Mycolicibacterium fluoranthenivorans TaxID=258505 RepID=A0A7X5ZAS2_9MYCO|nr:hypothetical protein [Mycolicibacterium fluoranthenivorans]
MDQNTTGADEFVELLGRDRQPSARTEINPV